MNTKNNAPCKVRSVVTFCAFAVCTLSVAIGLSSCGSKPDESVAPSPAMSAKPSTASSAAPSTSPSAMASSPSAMASASPQAEPTLSATATTLGVKPTNPTTCPASAPIKGKVTKKRGNIYHGTKDPDFAKIKPEICFKDIATAEKAGFRAPK